ncbi:MAG: phosphotransferase, partial [Saprospiraceae bacterium]|nr:phosphotransferase [Saprospiraceae bacterium]
MIIAALPVEQNLAMVKIFQSRFGYNPTGFEALPQAGSSRKYIRLFGNKESAIGVWGKDHKENEAFISWAEFFRKNEIEVPEIYGQDLESGIYLQEDLGRTSLLQMRSMDGTSGLSFSSAQLYKKAILELIKIQSLNPTQTNSDWYYPEEHFDNDGVLHDLRYGLYYFVKPMQIQFDPRGLERDFKTLAKDVISGGESGLMIRDFQARNLMVRGQKIVVIDFQGLRKGPKLYDLISLLYQAKAGITSEDRKMLFQFYLDNSKGSLSGNNKQQQQWIRLKLVRFMQVLGAYGYRGLFEKKPHFLGSIPMAISNIRALLKEDFDFSIYPELHKVLVALSRLDISPFLTTADKKEVLNIRVTSFS